MAKSNKAADRRAKAEQIRREQQRAEKRRTYAIIGGFVAVALVIVGLGAYPLVKQSLEDRELEGVALADIGTPMGQASCQEPQTEDATGNADHRDESEELTYDAAPPSFGYHYPTWAPLSRKFYTADDRPKVGYLVHNLEHGYNILWYDETVADDPQALKAVRGIADKFPGEDFENKFIAAPWTAEDGGSFPDGAHVALTHWSADDSGQQGVTQYCGQVSGEAVEQFVDTYPYTDSPEPNAM